MVKLGWHVRVRVQLPVQIEIEDALEGVTMGVEEVLVVPRIPVVLDLGRSQQSGRILFQIAPVYDEGSPGHIDRHQVVLDGTFGAGSVEFFGE